MAYRQAIGLNPDRAYAHYYLGLALALKGDPDDGEPQMEVVGHFGGGILSFRSPVIFRTAEGFNLWVTGPPNSFKDGIQALSAVVETDWMPFPFAMSWKFTRPGLRVHFEKGEPYCFLFPVERGLLQRCEPSMHRMEDDPELTRQYRAAHYEREFPQVVEILKGVDLHGEKWQGWYMRGELPDKSETIGGHERRLELEPFEREDG